MTVLQDQGDETRGSVAIWPMTCWPPLSFSPRVIVPTAGHQPDSRACQRALRDSPLNLSSTGAQTLPSRRHKIPAQIRVFLKSASPTVLRFLELQNPKNPDGPGKPLRYNF